MGSHFSSTLGYSSSTSVPLDRNIKYTGRLPFHRPQQKEEPAGIDLGTLYCKVEYFRLLDQVSYPIHNYSN